MGRKFKENPLSAVKLFITLLAELFSIFSIVFFIVLKDRAPIVLMCLLTVALSAIPFLFERAFKISYALPFYIYATVYALGPMLGYSYRLYLLTDWWDKFLHFSGGYFFAQVGYYLAMIALDEDRKKARIISAIFAFCFTVTISVLWEFVEFGFDQLFGMDMQNDTYITEIHSYFLGDPLRVGEITGITDVTVNGTSLNGYIDIGLIDSMGDMLIESFGGLLVMIFCLVDQGRHPIMHTKDGRTGRELIRDAFQKRRSVHYDT